MTSWRLFTLFILVFMGSSAWPATWEKTPQASNQSADDKPFAVHPQESTAPSEALTHSAITHQSVLTQQALPPSVPKGTQLQLYIPFEGSHLVKDLSIKKQVRGLCVGSVVDERKGVWRCLSGGNVYDPCFKGPKNGYGIFACTKAPWDKNVVLLTATDYPKNSNKNTNLKKMTPWAIELANHHQCILLTGARGLLNDLRMSYRCHEDSYVLGDLDKTKPFWQANFRSMKNDKILRVKVETAWY